MFKGYKTNKELEIIIASIDSNMANNYKDAAQLALKEFENKLIELTEKKQLSEKQKIEYEAILESYQERMKAYSHKDQKPYWT